MGEGPAANAESSQELNRLWLGFMTSRVMLGILLVVFQFVLLRLGSDRWSPLLVICIAYFVATLCMRLLAEPGRLGPVLNGRWVGTVGLDMPMFAALQIVQGNTITYVALFALPVLMASVLGSLLLAMGAAAAVTLFLLGQALWLSTQAPSDLAAQLMQAALTGTGCFSIAFLANQIATRLESQETKAERSNLEAKAQALVNTLVIESLTDGILVVDSLERIKASNPAALDLLGKGKHISAAGIDPAGIQEWPELVKLARESIVSNLGTTTDITIRRAGQRERRIQVRTKVTATQEDHAERLCVMFLKDQREIEARMRKDKLASMARMSVAVAHEIRNPLSAITQANALLAEDILEPRHQQLIQMIHQNARRLEKIVDEVLNVTRLQTKRPTESTRMPLAKTINAIHREWIAQRPAEHSVLLGLACGDIEVFFEPDHLRQVLINLLDNARRYASHKPSAIQIHAEVNASGRATMSVWSDGRPMDPSVESHLFEPFFSSESRSSGLGLYICRELCEGHGATIGYSRDKRLVQGSPTDGNEFIVQFNSLTRQADHLPRPHTENTEKWKMVRL